MCIRDRMCTVQERKLKNEQKSSIGVYETELGNARTQNLQWSLLGSLLPNGLNIPKGNHLKTTTTKEKTAELLVKNVQ